MYNIIKERLTMNNYYAEKFEVDYGKVDILTRIRIDHILELFQAVAIKHCKELGMGYYELNEKDNAFWVLSKIKVELGENLPKWGDTINVVTYPNEPKFVKFLRNYYIETASGERPVKAVADWCVLERGSNKIKRASDLSCYPINLMHTREVVIEPDYFKFNESLVESGKKVISKKVLLSDLDSNLHMNNVNYARLVLDAIKPSEYLKKYIAEFELQYVSQVYAGDTILVKRVKVKDEIIVFGKVKGTEKLAFRARVKLAKRKKSCA